MDYREMQANAHRLLTALRIAEANETANPVVHGEAIERARGYLEDIEVELDRGWKCARCGTVQPAEAGSCRGCQDEITGAPA